MKILIRAIREIRGKGLWVAIELNGPARPICEALMREGLLCKETHDNVIRHNVTVVRLYKDGEDWKSSDSFGRDDLPLLCKVADQAHTWIFAHQQVKPEKKN